MRGIKPFHRWILGLVGSGWRKQIQLTTIQQENPPGDNERRGCGGSKGRSAPATRAEDFGFCERGQIHCCLLGSGQIRGRLWRARRDTCATGSEFMGNGPSRSASGLHTVHTNGGVGDALDKGERSESVP